MEPLLMKDSLESELLKIPNNSMKNLLLIFSVLLSTSLYGQIGPDGTGTVNGYNIAPYAYLYDANLSGANLSGANLSYADLRFADLSGANLSNAVLIGTGFIGADLEGADLRTANLSNASLSHTRFYGADLRGALLSGTISDAILEGANLSGVNFENTDLYFLIPRSDYDAVVAERDARPTQAAYDAVVVERDSKLTLDEVKDLRAGSTMIEIHNGQATLTMDVEESDDFGVWTTGGTASVQINVQPGEDNKFFRFKMDDSDSSSDETGVEIPLSYVDLVVNLSSEGSYDFISVSNHPLNDYNGVYYTQPDLINNMPYFKSGNQKYLYFYKGASGGLFSWSFYNALPDGISDLFTGGWIHPYPVLETGNFNIFEVEAE